MNEIKFKKQKEIIELAIKNKAFSREFSDGYINALYDYNLINDNQFDELYALIWEETINMDNLEYLKKIKKQDWAAKIII